jgi:hypothetical protein
MDSLVVFALGELAAVDRSRPWLPRRSTAHVALRTLGSNLTDTDVTRAGHTLVTQLVLSFQQ